MQERHQIKEQIGVLEEQLELLGALASTNEQQAVPADVSQTFGSDLHFQDALEALRSLFRLLHEQQQQKSIPAKDFLARIIGILVQDASAQGVDLAVTQYGEGKISLDMAELVIGSIVAGLRASIKSYRNMSKAERMRHFLFPALAIYIEVRSSAEEVQFRLVDDGSGYQGSEELDPSTEKQLQKLRLHIARTGGWFGRKSLKNFGGMLEFKVPLPRNRFDTLHIRSGQFEALLPFTCVAEVAEDSSQAQVTAGMRIARLSAEAGLEVTDTRGPVMVRIGVADFQFWITCDAILSQPKARRIEGTELVNEDSWFQSLGIFHEQGVARVLPLLEGQVLLRIHSAQGDES